MTDILATVYNGPNECTRGRTSTVDKNIPVRPVDVSTLEMMDRMYEFSSDMGFNRYRNFNVA